MDCELCGDSEADSLIILSLRQPDGRLNTIACLKCARESPAYCNKHERPHVGFEDNTTACLMCIEEMVRKHRTEEMSIFHTLEQKLPRREFDLLLEWADVSSSISGDSAATCILRALATKARRTKKSIAEIVEEVTAEQSISSILPTFY